ncbi:MAG: ATP-grasp domain-containing protein [Microcystaceae cyanobacterium]
MDLLEYQAKELFNQVGIPILPSQPIKTVGELKWLRIPYPIVLKSQVRVGGRGKAGGVRFVENTIDAIAAANAIFNLPISGEYPEVILAEAEYNVQEELFLSVLLDYELQRPVLLGSSRGGMDIESFLDQMQEVVIEEDFSPFYARRLALKMGLKGELIRTVSEIIEKMYGLFLEKDLDFIEINPLALNEAGQVMALDGKISVNEAALTRHPDILTLTATSHQNNVPFLQDSTLPITTYPNRLKVGQSQSNVAIISNSEGLGLSAWDALAQQEIPPHSCYILNERDCQLYLQKQLTTVLNDLGKWTDIKVIIINWLSSAPLNKSVSRAIADYLIALGHQSSSPVVEDRMMRATGFGGSKRSKKAISAPKNKLSQDSPSFIVRLVGSQTEELKKELTSLSAIWVDQLEDMAKQTVKLTKA